MELTNRTVPSAASAVLLSVFTYVFYFIGREIPYAEIYIYHERVTHIIVLGVCGVLGAGFVLLGVGIAKRKPIRIAALITSGLFWGAIPLLLFVSIVGGWRGWEYGLESLLIGGVPALFIVSTPLILSGYRKMAIAPAIGYGVVTLYHVVLLGQFIHEATREVGRVHAADVAIALGLVVFAVAGVFLNVRALKK